MSRPITALFTTFLVVGLLYGLATPPFEASDEVFHYPFVRHVALGNGLPIQSAAVKQPWEQVGNHPPAYYYLGAAMTFWIDTGDFESLRAPNPFARIGIPGTPQNINYTRSAAAFVANPYSLRGSWLAIYLIRLVSLAMSTLTVLFTYLFANMLLLSPDANGLLIKRGDIRQKMIPILTTALVAFNPMFVFISASVNNDALTWLVAIAALVVVIQLTRGPSIYLPREIGDKWYDLPAIGVLLGIAALSKVSALALAPLVGLALLAQALRLKRWQGFFIGGAIIVAVVTLLAGWWYWRNQVLYGEWLALNIHSQITATRADPYTFQTFIAEFPSFWLSFWAMFGSFNIKAANWVYAFFTLLTLAAVGGGVLAIARRTTDRARQYDLWLTATHGLLILIIAVTAIGLLRWNFLSYAAQGRLMFTTLPPLMFYMALGLARLSPPKYWRRYLGLLVGVLGWIAVRTAVIDVAAAYLPARPVTAEQLPADLQSVRAVLAPGAELIGYTIQSPRRLNPAENVIVTLYWRATAPIADDYNVFLHVLGRSRELVGSVDSWPGGGLRPTSFWREGDIYSDRYEIALNAKATLPSQLLLDVAMWHTDANRTFPIVDDNGREISSVIIPVGLLDSQHAFAAAPSVPDGSTFEGGITLLGYDPPVEARANIPATLTLYWQASQPIGEDLTVFVHVVDESGVIAAQADAPPLNGEWNTSSWIEGRVVVDARALTFPAAAPYTIRVGLYNPLTEMRLPAFQADLSEWPDHAVVLKTILVK